ncbi:MAG TPA: TrbI/VirB10 family protein [Gemmatimonadales bacterium]|jgi:type IV secretion system protein VirB10|nr:TrbI/VirB10 family protein [Gemmatimonadales bacterium]
MSGAPPLKPLPPLAKRLNRNALTVGAVIMGMTVLTAVVLVRPSREAPQTPSVPGTDETPAVPSRPTFLDEPVRAPSARPDTPVAGGLAPPFTDGDLGASWSTTDGMGSYAELDASSRSDGSPRERAYRAALMSAVVLGTPLPPAGGSTEPDGPPISAEEDRLLGLGDSVLYAAARGMSGGRGEGVASLQADRRRKEFLDAAGDARGTTVIARLEPAGSPYTLRAGTVIPGLLLTGVNSDLPGELVAQVSRDIFDSRTQRTLLIPKGARLIGTYDNQVVAGQGRLLVAWTRLILPDGRSLRLPGLALKDLEGQTGAKDRVDTHWERVFGKALLLSAISAGAQLSQPQQTSAFAAPSAGQVAAGALGQELSNVALEILRRGMDVVPTITIRQGHPFNVFLNGDLVFEGPYAEETPSARVTTAERP